jgi:hypothetical protein
MRHAQFRRSKAFHSLFRPSPKFAGALLGDAATLLKGWRARATWRHRAFTL